MLFQAIVPNAYNEIVLELQQPFEFLCGLVGSNEKEVVSSKKAEYVETLRNLNEFIKSEYIRLHTKIAELEFSNASKRGESSRGLETINLRESVSQDDRPESTPSHVPIDPSQPQRLDSWDGEHEQGNF